MFLGLTALDKTNYIGFAGAGAVALEETRLTWTQLIRICEGGRVATEDGDIQADLGEVPFRQRQTERAMAHLVKAIQLDPGRKDPVVNRARAIVTDLDAIVKELRNAKKPKW